MDRVIYENQDIRVVITDKSTKLYCLTQDAYRQRMVSGANTVQDFLSEVYPDAYEILKAEIVNKSRLK